jgi:hypothetical protein
MVPEYLQSAPSGALFTVNSQSSLPTPDMATSTIWVVPRMVELKTNKQGNEYYAFIAIDKNFKRYRVFSDACFKGRLIHFISAIEANVQVWMPILPKKDPGLWYVSLDEVDDEPPVNMVESEKKPIQLSFESSRRNFVAIGANKKQTFVITDDYAKKADHMTKRLQFDTKSNFLANIVANQLDMYEKMDAIC